MSKKKSPQDLSIDELRWLLIEKRRATRQDRLERYRRTGRVVSVASDLDTPSMESWRTRRPLDFSERPMMKGLSLFIPGIMLREDAMLILIKAWVLGARRFSMGTSANRSTKQKTIPEIPIGTKEKFSIGLFKP